jgi:hypothetical protein
LSSAADDSVNDDPGDWGQADSEAVETFFISIQFRDNSPPKKIKKLKTHKSFKNQLLVASIPPILCFIMEWE